MTNIQLADEIKRYRETAEVGLSWLEISSILHRCESALRATPEPETPSKVCWLACDDFENGRGGLWIHEHEPQREERGEFMSGSFGAFDGSGPCKGILLPGQKCRVTFGPVIDCNPKPEPVKSLGQVWYEAITTCDLWNTLPEPLRDTFDKKADAIVAEYERRKGAKQQ
jgi:hypothetical protein